MFNEKLERQNLARLILKNKWENQITARDKQSILEELEAYNLTLSKDMAGECYIVRYGNAYQLQPSYKGMVRAARLAGMKSINIELIYEGEKFVQNGVVSIGHSPYVHEFDPLKVNRHEFELASGEKSRLRGGYYLLVNANGGFEYGVVPLEIFQQAQKMSKGAFWKNFLYQMRLKTIFRWAMKTQTFEAGGQLANMLDLHEQSFEEAPQRITEIVEFPEAAPVVAEKSVYYLTAVESVASLQYKEDFTEFKETVMKSTDLSVSEKDQIINGLMTPRYFQLYPKK
jgi:recombinational DNA repair protein RecT